AGGWYYIGHRGGGNGHVAGRTVTIYYTKYDGHTEVPYSVSLGAAHDLQSVAFYAATQAVAGPPSNIEAIRFPSGTHVRKLALDGTTAIVDISGDVNNAGGGSLDEGGMFKSLVWTLTALHGIDAVSIRVEGSRVATIKGGHLELDEPLARSSW
ncbi:MAG: GerMN domain-containing protein, partial [Acidimicrobiia bacterium]|nr:GerMN domain-containing protein [Acidimicrobiia bacterium]